METSFQTTVPRRRASRHAAFALTALAGFIAQAYAQQAAAPAAGDVTTITVTGIRASLNSAAKAKREALGLTDSIHAEDMGKFPDNNVAESIGRIPGVQIQREVTGEGLNIQIRGLGSSFTRVLLNGAPIASASTGVNNFGQANREVDLDFLPGDLFSEISVAKSPDAGMVEGGIAGTVDMRLARPFDKKGRRGFFSFQGTKNQTADKTGTRGAAMFSNTIDDRFGFLVGLSWAHNPVHVKGFESVGYTNANMRSGTDPAFPNTPTVVQSTAATPNSTAGGNYSIPLRVPAAAAGTYSVNGSSVTLTAGQAIDQDLLLRLNPGASIQQIDNGLVARLPRPVDLVGDRDRLNAVLGLEWRPNANLRTYVDVVGGQKRNHMLRTDINIAVRNNALIPMGMSFDRSDCTTGCVVEKATFANAQGFLEYRPWDERTDFWSVNPGLVWQINDDWTFDLNANQTQSQFHRNSPTVLATTNNNTPSTISYVNTATVPTYTSSLDLNNPTNFGWYPGNNLIAFNETRRATTTGSRFNLSWSANPSLTVKVGGSIDDIARRIRSYQDNGAWATQARNAVNTAALPGYMVRDPLGYVTLDWKRFSEATGYAAIGNNNTETSAGTNAGTTPGYFQEKITAVYALVDGNTKLMGNTLRYNAGVRQVHTDQTIGTLSGAGATLAEGRQNSSYKDTLPSASAAYNLANDLIFRASMSKSMTRADPTQMRVLSLSFTDPAASAGNLTNPDLKPYLSTNIDLGLEWYTGKTGYLAAAYFNKSIKNFTAIVNTTVPFSSLAQYGTTYATLTLQQQQALDNRGGPNSTTVVLSQQQNTSDLLKIKGLELTWSQPLDALLPFNGLGFTTNYTRVLQRGGPSGFIATGVAPWTANFTGYYETDRGSVRVTHTYTRGSQLTVSPQNGLNVGAAQLYSDNFHQTDLSTRLEIGDWVGWKPGVSLSLDVWNMTDSKIRRYFQFSNAAYDYYQPGRSYFLGVRAKF